MILICGTKIFLALISSEPTPPAVLHPPPPHPPQTVPASPVLLQTPQGTVLMQHSLPVQGGFPGFQQIDMPLPIITAPRTSIIPQVKFITVSMLFEDNPKIIFICMIVL